MCILSLSGSEVTECLIFTKITLYTHHHLNAQVKQVVWLNCFPRKTTSNGKKKPLGQNFQLLT